MLNDGSLNRGAGVCMRNTTRGPLLAAVVLGLSAPASAQDFYTTLSEINASDGFFQERTSSNLGQPPQSSITSTAVGSRASNARTQVFAGRVESWADGSYDTLSPPPEGEDPAGDGFAQVRALGFVANSLVIDADAPGGFLQVALAYNNAGFFETDYLSYKPGTITALYDIYYRFSAGVTGAETSFVDYNRRTVAFSFSSGTGFVIDNSVNEYLTGNFASGQVFLVPFTSGESLSILLTGDCTGTVEVNGAGSGRAGCGDTQAFGWGGILGAVDDKGNPLSLRSVTSNSGTDYFKNLSGLAFDPVFGVPEPAIWAQFILGFGLAGGFARRRRALAA